MRKSKISLQLLYYLLSPSSRTSEKVLNWKLSLLVGRLNTRGGKYALQKRFMNNGRPLQKCKILKEFFESTGLRFVCLFGFLTSSSTTRLYRGRAPRQSVWQFYVLPHEAGVGDHDFCLSRSHYTDTDQPVGSGRPQRESNPGLASSWYLSKPGPPHQESRALPTELTPPPPPPQV